METALENHEIARDLLISRERALGHHASRTYTAKELRAIDLIAALEKLEKESLWTSKDSNDQIYLGMPFTSSKSLVDQSKLFSLIKFMPKGALLHCHLDATNNPSALLQLSFSHANLGISSSSPFIGNNTSTSLVEFKFFPIDHQFPSLSLFTSTYVPNTMNSVQEVRKAFPGGESAFDNFIIKKLTVTPETLNMTPTQVWDHFGATFILSAGLLNYEPVWEEYIVQILTMMRDDSVPYIECRINFLHEFITNTSGSLSLGHRDWVRLFSKAMKRVRESTNESTLTFWGAKIIYSTIRFIEKGEGKSDDGFHRLRWFMEDCINLKKEFPDLIAGFDLVGWEDGLKPLSDYVEDLLWFKERQKECGVEIPYLFHAGETLSDGGKADMNLYDAILLDTKRIGHAFSLDHHPLLMEICKERQIAVECCPISNELLRYTASTSTHPLSVLLSNNVPVSLSCDDPQFFGNYGLSYDFYSVFTTSEIMNIIGLGKLARQSISYTMLTDEEKVLRLKEFDIQFDRFLDLVVEFLGSKC